MVEIKIHSSDEGQRLNKYLMKYLNQAPSSFVYKMLRKKNIVLNDKKAKGDELLKAGDCLKLYLSDDTIEKFRDISLKSVDNGATYKEVLFVKNLSRNLNILYEDENIMAVNKPAGVLSQKATKDDYSINEAIVDYIADNDRYTHSDVFKPSVCNRLDKNTSGIILAGITLKGSQYLSRVLKDRSIDKFYFTIVHGDFKDRVTNVAYISKDRDKNISSVVSEIEYESLCRNNNGMKNNYSKIVTEFIPLSTNHKSTLLKVKLITGKSHQIRAHLKFLGFPIAGDMKYGSRSYNSYMKEKYGLNTHLLHAGIVYLEDDKVIKCPLPDIFIKICKGEGLDYTGIL